MIDNSSTPYEIIIKQEQEMEFEACNQSMVKGLKGGSNYEVKIEIPNSREEDEADCREAVKILYEKLNVIRLVQLKPLYLYTMK
jgi:hypothetical protein